MGAARCYHRNAITEEMNSPRAPIKEMNQIETHQIASTSQTPLLPPKEENKEGYWICNKFTSLKFLTRIDFLVFGSSRFFLEITMELMLIYFPLAYIKSIGHTTEYQIWQYTESVFTSHQAGVFRTLFHIVYHILSHILEHTLDLILVF